MLPVAAGNHERDASQTSGSSRKLRIRFGGGNLRLFRRAHYHYAALLLFAVVGFWQSYFQIIDKAPATIHFHNFTMMLWLVLLMTQAWLITAGKLPWHRRLGKASYVLVPPMVFSGLLVTRQFLQKGDDGLTEREIRSLVLPLYGIVLFAVGYGLAIFYKKRPALHARWMTAATMPLLSAAFLRIFQHWVPGFESVRAAAHASYFVVDLVFLALVVRDWKLGRVVGPFLVFFLIYVQQHVLYEWGGQWTWWRQIAALMYG